MQNKEAAQVQQKAQDDLNELEKAVSLNQFLSVRTKSDDYLKHLGLISTIRRDFDSLAEKLANATTNILDKYHPVDRIILYIDDLDRCPADKVMEVLQAVHLLLAYKLFVVVVGVDPRWLLHSLNTSMSAFQNKGKTANGDTELWTTTPQNFLEKIFQIPFSLRPMSKKGYGKMMDGLFLPTSESDKNDTKLDKSTKVPEQKPENEELEQTQLPNTIDDSTDSHEKPKSNPEDSNPSTDNQSVLKKTFVVNETSLVIQPWESDFAKKLFPLMVSPRGAKRFTNIYRLLKATVGNRSLGVFEGSQNNLGDFQVPMLLVAILVGDPEEAARRFPRLFDEALLYKSQGKKMNLLESFDLDAESSDFTKAMKMIDPIMDSTFPNDPALFTYWLPKVSRFSFELGLTLQDVQ